MAQITLEHIHKHFTVYERPEGRHGVLRGAFSRVKRNVGALDDISFSIEPGELVGYIGPNGAGKSTSVKVMSGILTPDSGSCTIMGRVPWKERAAHVSRIGVVFGQRSQLWWDVPVGDSFGLLADIYDLSKKDYRRRLEELVETLDIGALMKTPVRQLSLGQRIRCELAASLLHRPDILFLDEPTIGLDAVSKLALRDFLREENRKHGVTMLLTTHDMDDIEALCGRIMVIGRGKLLYDGAMRRLKDCYAPLRIAKISLEEGIPAPSVDRAPLLAVPGVEQVLPEEESLSVLFDPKRIAARGLVEAVAKLLPVRDITVKEQDIDEIIAAMYKGMGI